jgi:flagellar protein FlgJ
MALDPAGPNVYTDFTALTRLKAEAHTDKRAATAKVARQFETIFTQMMLKSMRAASTGQGILDSDQSKAYRDMADQQLGLSLSTRGRGLGIASLLERQLGGREADTKIAGTQPLHPLRDTAHRSAGIDLRRSGGASAVSGVPLAHAPTTLRPLPGRPIAMQAIQSGTTTAVPATIASGHRTTLIEGARTLHEGLRPTVRAALTAIDGASDAAITRVRDALPASAEEFVRTMLPHARAAAEKLGVSVRTVLAHAALETGWGRHMPRAAGGGSSNNLFGIKGGSHWTGPSARVSTLEYENGVAQRRVATFRAYDSPSGAFADYANLLTDNPRYAAALGHGDNVADFGKALQHAGYATDPAYASKLSRIADSAPMRAALGELKNSGALPTI